MAEEKNKEAPKQETHWVIAFFPIVIIGAILILGAWFDSRTIFEQSSSNNDQLGSKKIFNIYEWIGQGELSEDVRIINTAKVLVRNESAGGVLGVQNKLDIGVIREGPIVEYGIEWFRVDYLDAPDGWVDGRTISSKISTIRMINIVPILYGLYKPIGYGFLIILLIIFIFYKLGVKSEEKICAKKLALKLENARERDVPLDVLVEQKPDVEELPGFQTEEIIPVEELEKQERWKHIQELTKSFNANDWRQAIIEADIMLEEMLDKMQYEGVTIGDKLKKVERSDFVTLDQAWSAHKVRNQIAHDGSNFKLTREIAERAIKDFEDVFREFYYI